MENEAVVEERLALRDAILAYIKAPHRADFSGLADRLYAYQQQAIPAYGRLAATRKVSHQSWRLAPLVPTEVFREVDLWDARLAHADAVMFRTSGTTGSEYPSWCHHAGQSSLGRLNHMEAPIIALFR